MLSRKVFLCRLAVIAGMAFISVGCAENKVVEKGKVTGSVKFSGNPVKDGQVQFSSKETQTFVLTELEPNGEFTLEQEIPVGSYKVTVLPPPEPAPEVGVVYKPREFPDIPMKYRDDFNSDLTADVKVGENSFTFDMKP